MLKNNLKNVISKRGYMLKKAPKWLYVKKHQRYMLC